MKRLKTAQCEPRLAGLAQLRPVAAEWLIRHNFFVEAKPDAQFLSKPIGAIQSANLIPADNPPDPLAAGGAGLQRELLRRQVVPKLAAELRVPGGHHNSITGSRAPLQRQQLPSAQIDEAPDFARRKGLQFRGVLPEGNQLRPRRSGNVNPWKGGGCAFRVSLHFSVFCAAKYPRRKQERGNKRFRHSVLVRWSVVRDVLPELIAVRRQNTPAACCQELPDSRCNSVLASGRFWSWNGLNIL